MSSQNKPKFQDWDHEAVRAAVLRGLKAALVIVDTTGQIVSCDFSNLPVASGKPQGFEEESHFHDLGIEINNKPARFETLKEIISHTGSRLRLERGVRMPSMKGAIHGWLVMSQLLDPKQSCEGYLIVIGASDGPGLNLADIAGGMRHDKDDHLFVRREGEYVRIQLSEIQAIEAMENYVQIITLEDRIVVHTTMKAMQAHLQHKGFVRVHRSYLVPLAGIERFDESSLRVGAFSIPVGKSYRPELLKSLSIL